MPGYDETGLDSITHEAAEAIELASLGQCSWQSVTDVFVRRFPGCFAAILNNDFVNDRINFMEYTGLDPDFASSYADYYITVNRWADYWRRMPSGSVFVSEDHLPAATFTDSEFYNDWLKPLDRAAGIGLKVDVSPTDLITLPIQFPLRYASLYNTPSVEVSRRLHGPIVRAVEAGQLLRGQAERSSAASALSAAGDTAAFVVDADMRLCEVNDAGLALITRGWPVSCRNARITFDRHDAHQAIAELVRALCASPAADRHRHLWRSGGAQVWSVRAIRLPHETGARALLPSAPRILLLVSELRTPERDEDLAGLADLFGLTRAETRLCSALSRGLDLAESALDNGIAYATARHHMKMIFAKTETHRQAQLVALIERYMET